MWPNSGPDEHCNDCLPVTETTLSSRSARRIPPRVDFDRFKVTDLLGGSTGIDRLRSGPRFVWSSGMVVISAMCAHMLNDEDATEKSTREKTGIYFWGLMS